MTKQTANYGLIKPEQTDTYNVDDFNGNMDTIDGLMKVLADTVRVTTTANKPTAMADNGLWCEIVS